MMEQELSLIAIVEELSEILKIHEDASLRTTTRTNEIFQIASRPFKFIKIDWCHLTSLRSKIKYPRATMAYFEDEYTYIAVLGVIFGFIFAFGIGANDVANAFGSSVSARSLSLGQAIILGSLMEFAGAVLIGGSVTGTIRGKIIKTSYYKNAPEIFMFGSLTALMTGMIWLLAATAWEFPVSTTHDIVAAYLGFSIVAKGFESIDWKTTNKIFISWFAAPVFSGILGFIFFKALLEFVLKAENTFERAVKVYPVVVFVALGCNFMFILFKSNNNIEMDDEDWGHQVVLPAALGGGAFFATLTYLFVCPYLRKRVTEEHEEHLRAVEAEAEADAAAIADGIDKPTERDSDEGMMKAQTKEEEPAAPRSSNPFVQCWDFFADNTYRQDLHAISLGESARAAAIWEKSTEFDLKSERLFQYLQIFTVCMASFAHGGNDVANAIAPVSGILQIYQDGVFVSKANVNKGILAMGGAAIGLGFTFFGYRIVKAVGFKLTAISPSRGFCIELGAALAVSLASYMQIPVSTTQCLVGATCGVGLASGGAKNVEWIYLARTLTGWIGVFFIVAVVNAGVFAFCVYSPSM